MNRRHLFAMIYILKGLFGLKIESGQSNLIFVNDMVVKRFKYQNEYETESKVLARLADCPYILQPRGTCDQRREIAYPEALDGDLYFYRREDGLSYPQLVGICKQIIHGVGAMHRAGYFHMDIKPENIVRDGTRVWVIDLGLATKRGKDVRGVGTPRTMAPEVQFRDLRSWPLTEACDWWSTGVTIFYIFSKFYKLPECCQFKDFPYKVILDSEGKPVDLEWPKFPPFLFSPSLFDLLFGRQGLISFYFADRNHTAQDILKHHFFM